MSNVGRFEFILLLIVLVVGLELVARKVRLPPAAALVLGGIAIALVPGVPVIGIDPDLVLIVFLPPLLLAGAYFSVWHAFRTHLGGILQLAVGGVAFTTFVVGVVTHWLVPTLPWAGCLVLGAIVAPPDAVAAKAVLKHVHLPERITTLLEGESLLDDAASLVIYRFAALAVLTGEFSPIHAGMTFGLLALGGLVLGGGLGWVWIRLLGRVHDRILSITMTLLLPWVAYIGGEMAGASGVITTVVAGLVLGWRQHDVFSADERLRWAAVWEVLVFVLESLVFVLIGISLHAIVLRHMGTPWVEQDVFRPVAGIVAAVLVSRFAWMFLTEGLRVAWLPPHLRPGRKDFFRFVAIMGWCGMRGVVSLAIVLALPAGMPERDVMQIATFVVILVTVLGQGTTIGWVIHMTGGERGRGQHHHHLSVSQARALIAHAQEHAMRQQAYDPQGQLVHARLLEQYAYRAELAERFSHEQQALQGRQDAHYRVLLATIQAGRAELLRLHRSGEIHDAVLHQLEHELDLQQMTAEGGLI
ncbi:sodium:proton antiporter [Komagataeibacter sp. FNDCF1]|uniref:cation:proton antiporter n=1 Tax=Komagataeibacter sp. FNDCF1 TaxID=2878681 RepID=UPI001E2C6FD5|nr:sodium:proton antiporter [Komagataeibacter sp. FNDCF1]MCE2563226.1 sodium:proton antiporter [Komagataeibacter sp. FNDCF1]